MSNDCSCQIRISFTTMLHKHTVTLEETSLTLEYIIWFKKFSEKGLIDDSITTYPPKMPPQSLFYLLFLQFQRVEWLLVYSHFPFHLFPNENCPDFTCFLRATLMSLLPCICNSIQLLCGNQFHQLAFHPCTNLNWYPIPIFTIVDHHQKLSSLNLAITGILKFNSK